MDFSIILIIFIIGVFITGMFSMYLDYKLALEEIKISKKDE